MAQRHNIYTQYGTLYIYVNSCVYVLTHWKPLHPLCSWSGYRLDSYVTCQDILFIKVYVSTASFCIRLINQKNFTTQCDYNLSNKNGLMYETKHQ
jgi:hypothetical protein